MKGPLIHSVRPCSFCGQSSVVRMIYCGPVDGSDNVFCRFCADELWEGMLRGVKAKAMATVTPNGHTSP